MIGRLFSLVGSLISSPKPLAQADLTDANRELIAAAAFEAWQAQPETAGRKFKARLSDGREVTVTGISAADPVVTDGEHFLMIRKKGKRWLHAGGLKDVKADNAVETPDVTALREVREEAGYVVQKDAKVEVMRGPPIVNKYDIRFYDPARDEPVLNSQGRPTGEHVLAKTFGLKPGDAFIIDNIGVKIEVSGDLSKLQIVPKGQKLTTEQEGIQARGLLLQAGDDAEIVGVIPVSDVGRMASQGLVGSIHYGMMQEALPGKLPPLVVQKPPSVPSQPKRGRWWGAGNFLSRRER